MIQIHSSQGAADKLFDDCHDSTERQPPNLSYAHALEFDKNRMLAEMRRVEREGARGVQREVDELEELSTRLSSYARSSVKAQTALDG